jgi:hypothetical protein
MDSFCLWCVSFAGHDHNFRLAFIDFKLVSIHPAPHVINALFHFLFLKWKCFVIAKSQWAVQLSIIGVAMPMNSMTFNDLSQWQNIAEEEEGSKDRTLRNTYG